MKLLQSYYKNKYRFISSVFLLSFLLMGISCEEETRTYRKEIFAGADQTIKLGHPTTFNATSSNYHPTNFRITYTWSEGNTILFTGKTFTKNDFELGVHTINLKATILQIGLGETSIRNDSVVITVVEEQSNTRPTATGADITTNYNTPVSMTLIGGDVDPQDSISFHYVQSKLPRHGVLSGNPPNTTYTPNAGYSGDDDFQFYVYDGNPFEEGDGNVSHSVPAIINITINPKVENTSPVSNAGLDASTLVGLSYKLDGTKSNDSDGDPMTYSWSVTSKPVGSTVTFSNTTYQRPKFTADKVGSYTLALTVNDGVVTSLADEVVINVISQLFSWCDADNGKEPWQRNGRSPSLLTDIATGAASSEPELFTFFNNKVFFSAYTNDEGKEVWVRDTEGNTSLFKDINNGANSSFPTKFTVLNDMLFFVADDGVNGTELWVTDGNPANSPTLLNINDNGSSYPVYLTTANDKLYFKANDGINGYEFWESDGTINGTKMIKNIAPNDHHSNIHNIVSTSHDRLFFKATDETTNNPQLWKSTGTSHSTTKIKDMGLNASLNNLTTSGSRFYFTSNSYGEGENPTGEELWKSDGSSDGTIRVADLYPGATGSSPRELISYNTHLYFFAQQVQDENDEATLWRTDRDNAPIKVVPHIVSPSRLSIVGDSLFYLSSGGNSSNKLWRLDAGSSTPSLVKDFDPIDDGSPADLDAVNNTLYITTRFDDPSEVDYLWLVDEITENSQSTTYIKGGCSAQ